MRQQNEQFPNAFQAFLLVIGLFLAEMFVGALLHDLESFLGMQPSDMDGVVVVLANACIFTVVMQIKGLTYRQLFHSSESSPQATLFVLLVPILLIVPAMLLGISGIVELLVWQWPLSPGERAMFDRMGSGSFSSIVISCAIAPVLEEMLFRGVVLRSFLRLYSRPAAILGSAALFGFAHLNLYQFAVAMVMGTVAGWLYERTRSLLPCILLHSAYNSALTVISLAGNEGSSDDAVSPFAWAVALVLAVVGIRLLRRVLTLRPVEP